ncbi:Dihydroorotate dehydrogenase-domain-containing protein [Lipomyces oligophaga]|uniref:Dihydroorotate dehydrogenase-domain-containing protein n=1 Tax=Lipomyces oligophaga TaxID=45792 RepID=UPI0034CF0AED
MNGMRVNTRPLSIRLDGKTVLTLMARRGIFGGRRPEPTTGWKIRRAITNTVLIVGIAAGAYYVTDSRSAVLRYVGMPFLRWTTDAEVSHRFAIELMKTGLAPVDRSSNAEIEDPDLAVSLFGKRLVSPVGLAAGFDKNAEAVDPLFDMGFAYVEVGSITPKPQEGNPKPRLFRLPLDKAAINRYGFNSDGHLKVLVRLRLRLQHYFSTHPSAAEPPNNSLRDGRLLAVNLGKNKTGDEVADYVDGVVTFGDYADVLVVNISSPNTPGLRDLQSEAKLAGLLSAVLKARDSLSTPNKPPVCVKVAPDLTETEVAGIADVIKNSGIDGVIISNTTISRPASLKSPVSLRREVGGLSGPPVKEATLRTIRYLRKHIGLDFTVIGCGGISSGKDAVEFAKAGATCIQVLTGFTYDGPGMPARLRKEIKAELNGQKWSDIINADYK